MKLSIIIPVYNVEQYLEKCLLSCMEQDVSYKDYEIIIVNDGSPDGSLAIAQRIAASAENIKVISQENGGLSAARNKGLLHAKGEYVWFIDSDDWIEINCLGSLTELCDGVDFIAISFNRIWSDYQKSYYASKAYTGKELLQKTPHQPAPFYIMRRDFLNSHNLRFMEGVFHEDMEFTPRMIYLANSIHTTQYCVYNYLQRDNSIMTTPNPKRAFDLIKVAESLFVFKEKYVDTDFKYIYNNIISLGINNALSIIIKVHNEEQKRWIARIKEKKNMLISLKGSTKIKYKIEGYIFPLFNYKYMIKLYLMFQKFNLK